MGHTRVGSYTSMVLNKGKKHTSLLQHGIDHNCKRNNATGPMGLYCKTFTVVIVTVLL